MLLKFLALRAPFEFIEKVSAQINDVKLCFGIRMQFYFGTWSKLKRVDQNIQISSKMSKETYLAQLMCTTLVVQFLAKRPLLNADAMP